MILYLKFVFWCNLKLDRNYGIDKISNANGKDTNNYGIHNDDDGDDDDDDDGDVNITHVNIMMTMINNDSIMIV